MPTLEDDIQYIRTEIRAWHARTNIPHPGGPADMQVDAASDDERQSWYPIDSQLTAEAIHEFEKKLPAPLPPFFRAYMLACHTLGMDFGEYHLPESRSDRALPQSFYALTDSTFWRAGYMQFGSARGCGDPLLFDYQSPNAEHDYLVVVFNHDVVPHEVKDDLTALKPYESFLAPSFREFFDLVLSYDDSIFPAPPSPEEERRNSAWAEVATILEQKGLPRFYRPKEVSPFDPWAIAIFLRNT